MFLFLFFVFNPQGYNNSKGVTLEASFTPDSQFVMIGKKEHSFCHVAQHLKQIQIFFSSTLKCWI